MYDMPNGARWWSDWKWSTISRRVRQREATRLLLHNKIRRAVAQPSAVAQYLGARIPPLTGEFAKMFAGSLLGFWIIAAALRFLHARPIYTFAVFGLLYSMQATYYKYKLSRDPAYKIPKCKCAGRRIDGTETVLSSGRSSVLGIPNSVWAGLAYVTLLLAVGFHHSGASILLALGAVVASAYLSYEMVAKIGSLCVACINMSALNILTLLQLLR